MNKNKLTIRELIIYYVAPILFVLLLFVRGMLVEPSVAVNALQNQGYSDVEVVDSSWILVNFQGCGSDAAIFHCKAINPAGKKVDINVCVGWPFKGATVRSP